jgi:glycosyltransferase involved in cell wall biosynthesis
LETARALIASERVELHLVVSSFNELYDEFHALGAPCLVIETFRDGRQAALRVGAARRAARRVAEYARRHGIQAALVPMWHVWDVPILRRLARIGVPSLLVVHDAHFHLGEQLRLLEPLLRAEIRSAAGLVTLTRYTARELDGIRGATRSRWLAPHPVPTQGGAIKGIPRSLPLRGPYRLLLPGRMVAYKGIPVFIDVVLALRRAGVAVDARLVGEGPAMTEALRAVALRAGVTVVDRWLSELELESEISRADIVVLPYVAATQSGIVPLALSLGVPVVATPVGGLGEQLRHKVDGIMAESATPAAVTAAVLELLGDRELYERCSHNAIALARTELTWATTADVVVQAVLSILESGGAVA